MIIVKIDHVYHIKRSIFQSFFRDAIVSLAEPFFSIQIAYKKRTNNFPTAIENLCMFYAGRAYCSVPL